MPILLYTSGVWGQLNSVKYQISYCSLYNNLVMIIKTFIKPESFAKHCRPNHVKNIKSF